MPVPTAGGATLPLHRVRFFDHTPSPITCLAFSPTPLPPARDPKDLKGKAREQPQSSSAYEAAPLVLARENGDVEIWQWSKGNPEFAYGNWTLTHTLPPTLTHPSISLMTLVLRDPSGFHSKDYAVPKLQDLRLFTAGSDSLEIVERCLQTGRLLSTYPIPSPPLWSMSVSPTHQLLCLATTSQNLHFVSIPPSPSTPLPLEPPPPHLLRSDALPSRTRTVSLAWGTPALVQVDDEWEWRDTYLVTGNSDSSFRRWDLPRPSTSDGSRTTIGRVQLGARAVVEKLNRWEAKIKRVHTGTIVWGVGVLPGGEIVTSDSLGNVTFWDGESMAQRQTFKAHKADAMCMVIGPEGKTVYSSGPDQRLVQITRVANNKGHTWAMTANRRAHSHDVRALSIFPSYIPSPVILANPNPTFAPVLASGGWDMAPNFTHAAAADLNVNQLKGPLSRNRQKNRVVFDDAHVRKMPTHAGGQLQGRLTFARQARLVVGRKDRSVGIWRILPQEQGWEKVLEMELQLRTNLLSTAVSDDGKWLAVSDLYETKLFRLSQDGGPISPKRVRSFLETISTSDLTAHLAIPNQGCGASSLLFTPDCQRLVMGLASSGRILVVDLGEQSVQVAKVFDRTAFAGGRAIKPKKANGYANGHANGLSNGHAHRDSASDTESSSEDEQPKTSEKKPWVCCLASSQDGQWLAVADLSGGVTIYNLDTLRLYATLPTFPSAPVQLAFPPAQSSLLSILLPTNQIQFYHVDRRQLLRLTRQLVTLSHTLDEQWVPALSFAWAPESGRDSRNSKVIIWSADWICTARLDLDLIGLKPHAAESNRRKRARQAREALEATSMSPVGSSVALDAGSTGTGDLTLSRQTSISGGGVAPKAVISSEDPDFCKVTTDRFKGVCGVGWFGSAEEGGEMVVVERPYADYVGQLPPAFWTGGFGRA